MSGEPDSAGEVPAKELQAIQFVALGLIGGLAIMTVVVVVLFLVALNGVPALDIGDLAAMLGYGSLVLVPLGLIGAFLVMPGLGKGQPDGATFGAYQGQFFIQAGLLEGPAIMMLIFFLMTGVWALLGGVAVFLAALIFIFPTAEKYRAWAADRTTAG